MKREVSVSYSWVLGNMSGMGFCRGGIGTWLCVGTTATAARREGGGLCAVLPERVHQKLKKPLNLYKILLNSFKNNFFCLKNILKPLDSLQDLTTKTFIFEGKPLNWQHWYEIMLATLSLCVDCRCMRRARLLHVSRVSASSPAESAPRRLGSDLAVEGAVAVAADNRLGLVTDEQRPLRVPVRRGQERKILHVNNV